LHFHPLIFFFLLLGSIQAFGLPGVIIGPLLLTLFYSLWEIYKLLDEYDADHD
jgi:predicted PurR-regulated permease PerM